MTVGRSLVDQLLAQEGSATIKKQTTEALLLVDKLGGREWRFDAGRFQVKLDFSTRVVTVSHDSGDSERVDLDIFLRRLQIAS